MPTPGIAAIAPRAAAELYGLEVIAADIADHDGNQTRFVAVARDGIPPRTGHDRTALVVYQRADEPGSLISILQEFAARRINLSNLISRPTKHGGLGDYCFIIFAEGHVTDELLADAMRALHAKQGDVKFFGSYPAADASDHDAREHADARWREADDWVTEIQRRATVTLPTHQPVLMKFRRRRDAETSRDAKGWAVRRRRRCGCRWRCR